MATLKDDLDQLRIATLELAEAQKRVEIAEKAVATANEAIYRRVGGKASRRAEAEPASPPTSNRLPDRIRAFLVVAKGGPHRVEGLAEALKAEAGSVRSALYVLRSRNLVERVGRGEWAITKEGAAASSS